MASDLPNCLDTVVANVSTAAFSSWCAEGLKRQVHAALQVKETLTPQDQADVKRWCADAGYEVIFSKTCSTAGDHARVAALRSIIRELWQRCFNIEQPGVSTLVVGASAYELKRWCTHGHIEYWMPMCEAKDSARSYLAMAREAMAGLRSRASKQQSKALTRGKNGARGALQAQIDTLSQFVSYYQKATDMPSSLHTASTLYELDAKATLLLMLDSSYNYGVQQ